MPRRAAPTLAWSAARQVYELSAGQRREQLDLSIEGPAWFAWLDGALTLVSAPAGFGKTTLLAQWLAQLTYALEPLKRARFSRV